MLSDEEKKAIKELTEIKELFEEDLKENYEVTAILDQIDLESLVIALNLIEKQSKEIEELQLKIEKEKEKNKELVEQNKDMKSLFNIQASIAKELDFNTNEKMVKFKDEYYVPDTMAINANIGEPKTIELRYISATKYLTKFD